MDEEDIPKIDDASGGEVCTVVLVFVALIAGMIASGMSFSDPSIGFAAFGTIAGLAAIAVAILTVSRKINTQ